MASRLFNEVWNGRSLHFGTILIVFLAIGVLPVGLTAGVVASPVDDIDRPSQYTHKNIQESVQICGENAQALVTSYNEEIQTVPSFLKFAVRGKEIHGVVHNDTPGNYTFVTGPNGTVQSYTTGTPESPSIRVITSCEAFLRIRAAGNPVGVFWSEYQEDRVKIVGFGAFNWLLIEILKHPLIAGASSLLLLAVLAFLVYYYVRRRRG